MNISVKLLSGYGNECPVCGSENVRGEEVSIDGTYATQAVCCAECGEEFALNFALTSISTNKPKLEDHAMVNKQFLEVPDLHLGYFTAGSNLAIIESSPDPRSNPALRKRIFSYEAPKRFAYFDPDKEVTVAEILAELKLL